MVARGALGSALVLIGTLWFIGILPAGRAAIASTVAVAQSVGTQNTSGGATLSASPSAATSAPTPPPPLLPAQSVRRPAPSPRSPRQLRRTSWSSLKRTTPTTERTGSSATPRAPYINSLATTYMSATNYYGQVHGSPPDYQALIAGEMSGSITKPSSLPTLVDELATAGISWKAYMETMPSACDLAATNDNFGYLSDHNPFLYYASTRTPSQCQNVVPYTQFSSDANSSTPPAFMFMVPNGCNDMHTECPAGSNTQISNGDAWLKNNLPLIQASTWYQQGGTVVITWDEAYTTDSTGFNGSTGGHVPTIVVSAATKVGSTHTFSSGGNLYGILRGIEERYGVPLLANTSTAANGDLSGAFGQATSNLLSPEDASFEGGTVGGWGPWTANASAANSTAQALDGTHSLKFTTTGAGWYSNSSMVPVTAGQTYTGVVNMRAATVGRPLIAWIRWNNSVGGFVGESDGLTGTSDVTTGWTQFTVTGTAPAGAVVGGVGIWDNSGASGVGEVHYLDVASLALGQATSNLLSPEDASFEGGTVGGWGSWTANASAANSTAQALDGTHSLKFTTTGAGWYSNSSTVPVTAGQTYTGVVSVRAATVGRPLIAWIRWNNSVGGFVGESDGLTGTSDVTTGWTQFTVTGTAPAGAVVGGVGIWDNSSASGVGEVHYLDEAQIALGTTTVWTP